MKLNTSIEWLLDPRFDDEGMEIGASSPAVLLMLLSSNDDEEETEFTEAVTHTE